MAETEKKSKRGRPKKVTPPEVSEVVNDNKKLSMTTNGGENVTVKQVQESLTSYYNKALGIGSNPSWLENLNTLQQHNPFLQNRRLKMISDTPGILSGEDLTKALMAPQDNELALRKQGWALSATQYLYYKILRMSADVPLFKWYKTPEFLQTSEYSSSKFIEEDKFVDEWLNTFDLPNTLKRVSLEVKREGKCVYVLRNSLRKEGKERHVNYCTWQKLPSNYVKLTGIGEHGFIASFNMLLFLNPAFNIKQYPDFMQQMWKQLLESGAITENMIRNNKNNIRGKNYSCNHQEDKEKGNTIEENIFDKYHIDPVKFMNFSYNYSQDGFNGNLSGILERTTDKNYLFWVQLPQELCYVFASDTSHAWAIPDSIGMYDELQNLTDFNTLSGLIASTPLTAMMTAEVPLIADSNLNAGQDQTALSPDTILGYQNKFNSAVSSNIDAYIAPFKNMKLQSLPNVPNSSDISTKATENFISKAGMGGLISVGAKPSVAAIKAAQLLYESECNFVTKQFESVLNMIINQLIGTEYCWKLHIWGGIYTFDTEVKRDKELFIAGGNFVLPKIASAYDMTLRDLKGIDNYIESLKLYEDFTTITQATQERINEENNGTTNPVGRPKADVDTTESDNTLISIDAGNNTSEMRDFVLHCQEDGKCMICGQDSDTLICEECQENFQDDLENNFDQEEE